MLDSYDTERRPHARAIINLARMMGALVMPRNRATALLVHGLMGLLQRMPITRPLFEDLKIKPATVRPDRVVLHDGPLASVDVIVRESLDLLGCASAATVPIVRPVTT